MLLSLFVENMGGSTRWEGGQGGPVFGGLSKDKDYGYIFWRDLKYPKELHNKHNNTIKRSNLCYLVFNPIVCEMLLLR